MTTPLDNINLQEYLNIPMELSKYSKQELLDMNPSGASYIPPTWTERKIRDTLLTKRKACITYLNQHKESLSLFRIGMLISIDNSNSIYLINGYEINEGFSISFKLIELKLSIVNGEPHVKRVNRPYSSGFKPIDINKLKRDISIKTIVKPALMILLNQLE